MIEHEDASHNLSAGSPTAVSEEQFTVGLVSEIGGEGARRYSMRVTAVEMEIVCRHWANVLADIAADDGLGYRSEWNERARFYARTRLLRFARHLGVEKVRAILRAVQSARKIEGAPQDEAAVETGPSVAAHRGTVRQARLA